jgi:hypothetical protein
VTWNFEKNVKKSAQETRFERVEAALLLIHPHRVSCAAHPACAKLGYPCGGLIVFSICEGLEFTILVDICAPPLEILLVDGAPVAACESPDFGGPQLEIYNIRVLQALERVIADGSAPVVWDKYHCMMDALTLYEAGQFLVDRAPVLVGIPNKHISVYRIGSQESKQQTDDNNWQLRGYSANPSIEYEHPAGYQWNDPQKRAFGIIASVYRGNAPCGAFKIEWEIEQQAE